MAGLGNRQKHSHGRHARTGFAIGAQNLSTGSGNESTYQRHLVYVPEKSAYRKRVPRNLDSNEGLATDRAARYTAQREAGRVGRNRGHRFEEDLASQLGSLSMADISSRPEPIRHLVEGNAAKQLIRYIAQTDGLSEIREVRAWWTGGLATSGLGDRIFGADEASVRRTKSDVVVEISHDGGVKLVGVGVKTCFNMKPTNAQLYFGTASSFCRLLRENSVGVSDLMEIELRKFCGDKGYRPMDAGDTGSTRESDPSRWYWEELSPEPRESWERLFTVSNETISRVLLQKAYKDDPIEPSFLLHLRHGEGFPTKPALAIYSIDEFVRYNRLYGGFKAREYQIRKGRFKNDPSIHLAPRFGVIQFQRGGQKQHPTQLQFNLKAGYFNHFPDIPAQVRH